MREGVRAAFVYLPTDELCRITARLPSMQIGIGTTRIAHCGLAGCDGRMCVRKRGSGRQAGAARVAPQKWMRAPRRVFSMPTLGGGDRGVIVQHIRDLRPNDTTNHALHTDHTPSTPSAHRSHHARPCARPARLSIPLAPLATCRTTYHYHVPSRGLQT